ncbi:hypothetical protein Tco_0365398 [Tanacetum coccineum]
MCSTLVSNTDPSTCFVSINVTDSPTNDLNNSGPVCLGPTSYAKLYTREPSRKSVNFRTLITSIGNWVDVAILFESIRAISERFANTTYAFFLGKWVACHVVANYFSSKDGLDAMLENGTPLMLDSYTFDIYLQSWGRSNYARAMIELRADEKLKDTIVVAMPKLIDDGFNMYTIRVEYEWKPPRCSSYKVFGHILNECLKKIISDVVKNLNNPRQATRGVLVGPKVSFKSTKQIYKLVCNKNGASTSGKKKQPKVFRQEVSNLNPFDTLNSIVNDDDLDDGGKPLPKVGSIVNADSYSEVE